MTLYLQSGIDVLNVCHFTYSPKTQQEQNFRKSLIISYRVNALQLYILEILCYHILSSAKKFKLKLISAQFFLTMISLNELSITLSTRCLDPPAADNLSGASNAHFNWKNIKQTWTLFEIASGTKSKPEEMRVATFLHVAGEDALEKYNGFDWELRQDKLVMAKVLSKFDDCSIKTDMISERYEFLTRRQRQGKLVTILSLNKDHCVLRVNMPTQKRLFAISSFYNYMMNVIEKSFLTRHKLMPTL